MILLQILLIVGVQYAALGHQTTLQSVVTVEKLGLCGLGPAHDDALLGETNSTECLRDLPTDKVDSKEETEEHEVTESSYNPERTSPAPKSSHGLGSEIGVPQELDPAHSTTIIQTIEDATAYVKNEVMTEEQYSLVRSRCRNSHKLCAFWSSIGECEKNPAYMHLQCAPVCRTCELLHVDTRCPLDPDAPNAWSPGDLDKTFQRITSNPEFQQYNVSILSQPPNGPWMVMFENFLTSEESARLIELGHEQTYERSTDVGAKLDDGTYDKKVSRGRTSTNAWCIDECEKDPTAKRVVKRIESLTGIPETNSENLQLLRYNEGQFYETHNDFIPHHVNRQCGPRILTFYMYLNDVDEGGGTNFPRLDKTVQPKRGRAVLWPSVYDHDPNARDGRTNHQALPVIKGVKYGANAWIHLRDFKGPNKRACT